MNTAVFTDTAGREWHLALDYHKLRAIRSQTGLDFGEVERVAEHWGKILASDTVALDVVWIVLADRTAGVSQDQWLAAMDGERLEAAREALLAAILNFTPPLKKGMVEEGAAVVMKRYREAIQQAEATIRELTETTTKAALGRLGIVLSSAPESSGSSTTGGV